jgi:hypothetical protein
MCGMFCMDDLQPPEPDNWIDLIGIIVVGLASFGVFVYLFI